MKNLAPIVLFVYNRLEHVRKTIDALKENQLAQESNLFIFSDGPKPGQEEKVQRVRKYLKEITGFHSVSVIERDKNWGLANSVIAGVTDIVNKFGQVIVMEDDIVCNSDFLQYMNDSLEKYKCVQKVFSITGYSLLTDEKSDGIPDTYFLKMASSWSWATWKDRWSYFDPHAIGYRKLMWNRKMREEFNYDNSYDFYSMLISQMKKESSIHIPLLKKQEHIDSWAIRWYWTLFKQGGLTLFPRDSFIKNIGCDGSGVHCGTNEDINNRTSMGKLSGDFEYEDIIEEQKWIRDRVKDCV